MKVNWAGDVSLSTIDWPGQAAYVAFLRGCPLRCLRCHNAGIRIGDQWISTANVKLKIKVAAPFIGAVVLSGGEPLMQAAACNEIVEYAHSLGLLVGVETSGFYPVSEGFDRVFVGLQTPLERGVYNSYVKNEEGFDRLVGTLRSLDPGKAEIRLVVFEDSEPDDFVETMKALVDFDVRLMKAGECSVEKFTEFYCRIMEQSYGRVLIA